jgi:hypothetical protein
VNTTAAARLDRATVAALVAAVLMPVALGLIFFYVPTANGDYGQRIFYFHVPIATTTYGADQAADRYEQLLRLNDIPNPLRIERGTVLRAQSPTETRLRLKVPRAA